MRRPSTRPAPPSGPRREGLTLLGRGEGAAGGAAGIGSKVTSVAASYSGGTKLWLSQLSTTSTAVALSQGFEYLTFYAWAWGFTPNLMAVEVTTAVAGAKIKLALYPVNADFTIGGRLASLVDLSGAAAGVVSGAIAPASWPGPGLYLAAIETDTAGVSVRGHVPCNLWPIKANVVPAAPYTLGSFVAYASGEADPHPALSTVANLAATSTPGLLLGLS